LFFFSSSLHPIRLPSHRNCSYNHSTPDIVQSSPSDVVFFYATESDRRLRLSIKSLRSSHSLCRIILFIPRTSWFPDWDAGFMSLYQVEVIRTAAPTSRSTVAHMIRYEYELNWLTEHISTVSRVLHSDAFDVFFQGDPFSGHIQRDELTFVVEPHCIRSCGWNFKWIDACYGRGVAFEMGHKFIVCSGSIGGSAVQYLAFLELLTKQREWSKCLGESLDQAIVNRLMWTGEIERAGIRYGLVGCDGGFFTMQWCVSEGRVLRNERGQVVSAEGSVPSYLHQYNRHRRFARSLFRACGL
jgi:hypothetical protein